MLRLASLLYSIIGASLAGAFVVVALVSGMDTAKPIIYAAILGFVLAVPLAYVIAKRLA